MAEATDRMTVPVATLAQLQSVIQRAERKDDGRRPVIVGADPNRIPEVGGSADGTMIEGSSSPLKIRSLIARHHDDRLVVLTDCERHELGDDLLARVAGERIWTLDRWETVKELFAARAISHDLSRRRYLADALIEARPLNGYAPVRTGILDRETALSALLREYLKIPPDLDSLEGFLLWATRPDAASLLASTRADVSNDIQRLLIDRFGPGTKAVLSILRSGEGALLIPFSLVGGVVHHPEASGAEKPRVHLEVRIGDEPLTPQEWRSVADAAIGYLESSDGQAEASAIAAQADVLLRELKGSEYAYLSNVIPSGFEQRIERAAQHMVAWMHEPENAQLADASIQAIGFAEQHADSDRTRITMMRMATRLIRRGTGPIKWGDQIHDAAKAYQADGAWFDRARTFVSRGETNKTLDELYATLTERANASRSQDNESFAAFHAAVSGPVPENALGLEDVMDEVVAPIAEQQPVLIVVFDGMGWPSFIEVYDAVAPLGWTWWKDDEGRYDRPALAVLPTVTEFSRTSLFTGTIRQGTGETETRGFREHPALLSVSQPDFPPALHHKAQLRQGGIDTVPDDLLADIANARQQVVAVVLNNIDERLKDVAPPPDGWGLAELEPLRWLLLAAQEAGRVVIATADHGHILDRGATQITAGGGGERWKPAELGATDGEIEVFGPRVVPSAGPGGGRAVLPWIEQVQYGARRNGYHGGFTPQEVLVPLAVLSVDDQPAGWSPVSFSAPAWWHHSPAPESTEVRVVTTAPPVPQGATPSLFDAPEQVIEVPWTDAAVEALAAYRTPQIRITDDEVAALLRVLDKQGGMAISGTRLAEMSGLPKARIGRYVSQLQQLVNIDGYGIVTVVDQEVRLDRAMLDRQLDIA